MQIYKRNCNNCGNYYEGLGKFYCSLICWGKSEEFRKVGLANLGRKDSEETIMKRINTRWKKQKEKRD